MANQQFEIQAVDSDKPIILTIVSDDTGTHWEIESDVWNEVQPPDKDLETCLADLVENMRVYDAMGVTYANLLLALAKDLLQSLKVSHEN